MSTTPSPIYSLLPAAFRTRDAAQGGPLQALFAVLESQYGLVKENLAQLYDDQFIETCAPWVIPYIGKLIGYNTVYTATLTSPDSRAEVANTIGYRRRKGTLVALEQITHDVSGRTTMAVEEFCNLVTTLSLRDVRPLQLATASLRTGADLEDLHGPFNRLNRTIDVRSVTPRINSQQVPGTTPLEIVLHGPGRFNVPQVSVWMWRWQSFPVTNAVAFSQGGGGYSFSSLGGPVPLFQTVPEESAPFSWLVQEEDVPEPISLQRFSADLSTFYPGSLELIADGNPVPLAHITCANLAESLDGSVCIVPSGMIAIDPQIGRIQYAPDVRLPQELRVNYNYGAPALIAGGYYDRKSYITQPGTQPGIAFVNAAAPFLAIVGTADYPTLASAVSAWNELPQNSAGTIILPNFQTYEIDLTGGNAVQIPAESQLLIAAAAVSAIAGVPPEWNNSCVTLRGNIEVTAPEIAIDSDGVSLLMGQLQFSGLWISGQLILSGDEACMQLADCTLVPGISLTAKGEAAQPNEPSITGSAIGVTLVLNRVITGPITLRPTCATRICSSIVDAGSPYCPAIAGVDLASPGATLHIEDSTVIGRVWVQAIRLASNSIFWAKQGCCDPWVAPVIANRVQVGCVRFSWLPTNSITPKQYLCLPANAASQPGLEPTFITLSFGNPSYCLLSGDVPMAIWKGADNGSQMGVYYQMQETEAVTNIQIRSAEYLPANLKFGVFLIPSRSAIEEVPTMEYGQTA
ncbi:MAG TPA: hypothetical protein VE178_02975, partial [Silvibacterium sp.]|nr:hypothetical protein [Silvibacterium sp.]